MYFGQFKSKKFLYSKSCKESLTDRLQYFIEETK